MGAPSDSHSNAERNFESHNKPPRRKSESAPEADGREAIYSFKDAHVSHILIDALDHALEHPEDA